MVEELLKYKAVVLLVWAILFLVWEYLAPASKYLENCTRQDKWRRYGRNLGLLALTFLLSPTLIAAITVFSTQFGPNWREEFLNGYTIGGWWIVIDLILLDFFIYWWHRVNHVLPFLWRFHEVHHLDETLDVTTATRFHFGEVIMSAIVRAGFVIVLDIPLISVVIFETMILLSSVFQHSNIRLSDKVDGVLSWLIVTPNWHWLHHHAVREDTDSRYANTLTIWDRLFGSTNSNKRQYDMKIGVVGRKERD
ncbi:MAG: sterol desaturase family protein, partial [Alphaproteobacteria bacterium]|nr:sterol desaturase family protein [Alphaproteobacteria bacterium]